MLDKAEAASPVDAVQAVTRELGIALGASTVSFLIADLSGRALVRLTQATDPAHEATGSADDRHDDDESASVLPLDGGPVEVALSSQRLQVVLPGSRTPEACARATGSCSRR